MADHVRQLSMESLPDYDDGMLALLFDRALTAIYEDLVDRPGLKKARKVSIELELVPKPTRESPVQLDLVETEAKVKLVIPNRETRSVTARPTLRDRKLLFNADTGMAPTTEDERAFDFPE